MAGPSLVLVGGTESCIASSDPFPCQAKIVSPVDGSVFLHNFGNAVALETPYKQDIQKVIVGIQCILTHQL